MKKLVSIIILVCVLMFPLRGVVYGTTSIRIPEYIQEFIQRRDPDSKICYIKAMYDADESPIAWLYVLSPDGYIVTDYGNDIIVEFSFSSSLDCDSDDTIYYGGPTTFYLKKDNEYVNLRSQEVITALEFEKCANYFADKTNTILSAGSESDSFGLASDLNDTVYRLYQLDPSDFPLYDYNPDGRCGSVVAAIIFAYFNNNGYSGLVPAAFYNNDVAFTDYLFPHIEGVNATAGSTTSDLVSGLNWYLEDRGFSDELPVYSISNASYSKYSTILGYHSPAILDLDNHPTYGEHWVVGYGYDCDLFLGIAYNKFAIVNDGWGDRDISVSWDYVGDLVYLAWSSTE